MLERLGEALEHERAFVADASHELRTPLAILRAELELALAEGRSPEELRAALASAAEETDRLTQLSEDLLTIAQTERGELPLRLEPVRLGEALRRRRVAALRAGREEGGRQIEIDSALGGWRCELTGCGSTRRSAPSSTTRCATAAGRSSCRPVRQTGAVEIHVRDRGAGFPADFLAHAFERFSRAPASQRDSGSGLGLAIVATVAEPTAERRSARNRADGGADVWLTLPCRPSRPDPVLIWR